MTLTAPETLYRERLWASVWFFLATALVIPASLLVFFPISAGVGIAVAMLLYAGCVAVLIANSAVLLVDHRDIPRRAGRGFRSSSSGR